MPFFVENVRPDFMKSFTRTVNFIDSSAFDQPGFKDRNKQQKNLIEI